MRKRIMLLAAVLALSACGSHSQLNAAAATPQARQAKQDATKIAKQCINKAGGVKAIFHCAIPPHHGLAFLRCLTNGYKGRSTSAIETDLVTCGEKYR